MAGKVNDDFVNKLQQCFEFYGKTFKQSHLDVWMQAFAGVEFQDFEAGMNAHYECEDTGRYLPKPADIKKQISIIKSLDKSKRTYTGPKGRSEKEIANAWLTYMKFAYDFEGPGFSEHQTVDIDTALNIVNDQAAKQLHKARQDYALAETVAEKAELKTVAQAIKDSIKPEHKIAEYWQ